MEFHPNEGVPYIVCYEPHHHGSHQKHNAENTHHYRMRTSVTNSNIVDFVNNYRAHKLKHEHKHEKNYELSSEHLNQKIARNNFKTNFFSLLKNHYDIIILFYHSKDWKDHHSRKAIREFNHAAHLIGKRIDHIQSKDLHVDKDFPVRLFKFDLSKNTRNGLRLKAENAPIIRMYRIHDHKHFIDHIYEADHPKDIIHFIYDNATHDLQLDDHIEEASFDKMEEFDEMDM